MAKKKSFHLTKSENLLMEILWEADRPLTRPEIVELAKKGGTDMPMSTFHLLVNNLMEGKYITTVNELGSRTKRHTRRYTPNVTRNEHYALQIVRSGSFTPQDIPSITTALFRYAGVSDPRGLLKEIESAVLGAKAIKEKP